MVVCGEVLDDGPYGTLDAVVEEIFEILLAGRSVVEGGAKGSKRC
jgi:hypothetical protein